MFPDLALGPIDFKKFEGPFNAKAVPFPKQSTSDFFGGVDARISAGTISVVAVQARHGSKTSIT